MTAPADGVAWAGPDGPRPHAALRALRAAREIARAHGDLGQVAYVVAAQVRQVLDADLVTVTCGDGIPVTSGGPGPLDQGTTGTEMATELVLADGQLGAIRVWSRIPYAFGDAERHVLHELADIAAATLAQAQDHQRHVDLADRATAVARSMAEGLVELDATGRVLSANTIAQQMLGFSIDEKSGQTVAESGYSFVRSDGSELPLPELPGLVALRTGEEQLERFVGVRNPEGRVWWLLVNAVPRRSGDRVTGVVTSFTDITGRLEGEQLSRRNDSRLRAAHALTGLAWWELDVATGRHEWSDAMFRLVGLAPDQEPPDHEGFIALLHPDDRPATTRLAEQGFTTGHGEVFRVLHPDGSVHYLQSWIDVDTDDAGRPRRVLGATIDVTQREEAVAALAHGRARLAAAMELTETATWEWDVHADQVTWSERMVDLMGWVPTDDGPRVEDFLGCVHPEDRPRMRELGERTIASGQGEEASYRVLHPDGSVRHVRAWTDVRKAADGTVHALWGTAMDITEQAEHEARLASSEEHFRVAFDNAPIGMSMISLAPATIGQYLRANGAFQEMLGYTTDELVGEQILDLTHPDDRDRDAAIFHRISSGETDTVAFEKRYLHKDGSVVFAWLTSSVVRGPHGEPLYLVTHAVDISDRLREQAELERLALTDTLTGLSNRTLLTDRLEQALARLQRTDSACAMLLLDVDRFKLVNDSLGHQVGDGLLVEIAHRLDAVTRADSTVARIGGDEFVVLVEGLKETGDIHGIARRLLDTLRRPYSLEGATDDIVATVSIGISVATSPSRSYVDLYREADLALYRAKDAGRDQYALFDDALRARADARMEAETLLRQAIAEDTLVALFQPIVDLTEGVVSAAEGLVRVIRPDGTYVAPQDFIDVAEETGLIVEVDGRMVEIVVGQYARLSAVGDVNLRRMTINVSARTLQDPAFVDRVRAALRWYDVPGDAIRIELTERSLLTTSPVVHESLERLAELGIHIGLDDFGTGYSALAYLQRFPLQFLKIDRSFVSRLGLSSRDDAVVAAVIDLAHAHDLVVIAEGVETPDQLAVLRSMGCDRAQGYLLGRPMRSPDLEDLLRADPRW